MLESLGCVLSGPHNMSEFYSWPQRIAEGDREGERDIKRLPCGAEVGGWHQRAPLYITTWLLLQLGEWDLGFSMGDRQLSPINYQ